MTDIAEQLTKLTTEKLFDVVKNYRQYGYSEDVRNQAISILESRGITREDLKLTRNLTNSKYDFAQSLYDSFNKNSKTAFVLYIIVFVTFLLSKSPLDTIGSVGLLLAILGFVLGLVYLGFVINTFFIQGRFYKSIGQNYETDGALAYFFLGMPLYIFMYFYFRNQLKEKMKEIQ